MGHSPPFRSKMGDWYVGKFVEKCSKIGRAAHVTDGAGGAAPRAARPIFDNSFKTADCGGIAQITPNLGPKE